MIRGACTWLLVVAALFAPGCTCGKKRQAPSEKVAPSGEHDREAEAVPRERAAVEGAAPRAGLDAGVARSRGRPAVDPTPAPPITGPAAKVRAPLPLGEGRVLDPAITDPADPRYASEMVVRAEIEIGTPDVEGEREVDPIAARLGRLRGPLRMCHQRVLKQDPKAAGAMVIDLHVDERGVVDEVKIVKNEIGDAIVECVSTRLRSMRLGAGDAVWVRIPVRFVAEG